MDRELLLTINVRCLEPAEVHGHTRSVVMIPFTGTAEGGYFTGEVIGTGTDTQKISPGGECLLSARYMLEGTDSAGKRCRIFVENETRPDGTLCPTVVTDSAALADWEISELRSEISPRDNGVVVSIFRV